MNVYDFDKTIFYPDSMMQFARFCLIRHPKLWVTYLPKLIKNAIKNAMDKEKDTVLHATLNSIVKYLDTPEKDIDKYWDKYEKNISEWYLRQKKADDLIISASPEYLLKPLTDKLGIQLIATIVDMKTGAMIGNVRLAREKAKYIIGKDMPMIDNFYSDSLSDMPLALLSERAFIVKDKAKRVEPWPHLKDVSAIVHKKIDID